MSLRESPEDHSARRLCRSGWLMLTARTQPDQPALQRRRYRILRRRRDLPVTLQCSSRAQAPAPRTQTLETVLAPVNRPWFAIAVLQRRGTVLRTVVRPQVVVKTGLTDLLVGRHHDQPQPELGLVQQPNRFGLLGASALDLLRHHETLAPREREVAIRPVGCRGVFE